MKSLLRILVAAASVAIVGVAIPVVVAHAQTQPEVTGKTNMNVANGSFEVKIASAESSAIGKQGGIARMTIDKVLSGDLVGTTKGEMLTNRTDSTGAMAYVAIETVTATLEGRHGTFVLIHNATMKKSDPTSQALHVAVVPASGTGELTGIRGEFQILIDGAGKHTYTFEYELP